ncbi:acyl-CoA synthetase [Pseudomonas schmalbachii]|uniref:Acyl-CoA synthetase n=1 Tax=Pseudomonas schmalbachii TaxID=2816993 RepID=A0ABS3TW88_9PSED|nr:acyl-CoA synthetase [Pseudomonas schmalbachii]MBO3277393.1 acyl-CoA synthetase [Pseudomonas schmalbachii]
MEAPKYLGDHAILTPERPAVINANSGETLTYRELDERSNRFAQYLHAHGLRRGDRFAMFLENNIRCFEICWAALRSGLLVVPINRFLTAGEVAYIVEDSNSKLIVSSWAMRETAKDLPPLIPNCTQHLMVDGALDGWTRFEDAVADFPAERLADEWLGATMMYSSGTTGRPKGVLRALPQVKINEYAAVSPMVTLLGYTGDSVYLSTAPLYHAAPMGFALNLHYLGATVVFMEKFDELQALANIERYRITHSQWVPTMFVRLLKLPAEDRQRYDLSSHRSAVHAAAPCPVEIKRQMIDWWGPIINEYYGGSEGNGATALNSEEWLAHPGSVGKPLIGTLHICDDEGNELPAGEKGLVYFGSEQPAFQYHNDTEKTRSSQHPRNPNWSAIGDIGYVDEDGFLYLTDRKSFMIISGGVNIYPQAIENELILHPSVADVAVIGVPNAEMGEEVKAVVELVPGAQASDDLAKALIEFLNGKIGRYMMPRSVDFTDQLPRLPTGKLYKQQLRERYWPKQA